MIAASARSAAPLACLFALALLAGGCSTSREVGRRAGTPQPRTRSAEEPGLTRASPLEEDIAEYVRHAAPPAGRPQLLLATKENTQDKSGAEGGAAAMARALQDPLANIAALMTENDIYFGTGDDATSAVFQIQPVYALNFDGYSIIPRGVIPIIGAAPASDLPGLGEPRPPTGSTAWGLGDIVLQAFWAPQSKGTWKWGVGPQVSLRTRTDSRLGGPGWGAGAAAVLVGEIGNLSVAFLANNLWGQDGFNTLTLQPQLFYNVKSLPGFTINYTQPTTVDWAASSSNRWTVPLGAGVSQTFDIGNGYGIDVLVGAYYYVESPAGGPTWSFKFNISILFPR